MIASLKKSFIFLFSILLAGQVYAQTSTGYTLQSVGTIAWTDSIEVVKEKLTKQFGDATIDDTNKIVTAPQASFAGHSALLMCHFGTNGLEKIVFTINYSGEGDTAFIADRMTYNLLKEDHGNPGTIDMFTGERIWQKDNNQIVSYKVMTKQNEATNRSVGTITGAGTLKGTNKRMYSQNEQYEGQYKLELGPNFNSPGLIFDTVTTYKELTVTSVVSFERKPAVTDTVAPAAAPVANVSTPTAPSSPATPPVQPAPSSPTPGTTTTVQPNVSKPTSSGTTTPASGTTAPAKKP